MIILQQQQDKKGSFYITENEEQVAAIEYTFSGENTLTIDHTEVDERMQGKQVGAKLVEKVADFAREKNYKIIPRCSYAAAIMKRESRFTDVLA